MKEFTDAQIKRYQAAVENGKKGAEFGKKGGRPRKGETKEEYLERKGLKTPVNSDSKTPVKTPVKPRNFSPYNPLYLYNNNYYNNINKNNNKNNSRIMTKNKEKEIITNDSNYSVIKENLETVFRGKLKEGDNRKWVTDFSTFEIALAKNPEFLRWIGDYDRKELRRLWNKFRVTYLTGLSRKKKELDTQESADTVPAVIAPETDSQLQEIYDYLFTKMKEGYFKNCFKVELWNNPKLLQGWIALNGYSYDTVQAIFELAKDDYKALYMSVSQLSEDFPEEDPEEEEEYEPEEQEVRITC